MTQPQVEEARNEAPQPAPYQAPVVTDLGAWQSLTLIYSVPVNPGKLVNPGANPNGF